VALIEVERPLLEHKKDLQFAATVAPVVGHAPQQTSIVPPSYEDPLAFVLLVYGELFLNILLENSNIMPMLLCKVKTRH